MSDLKIGFFDSGIGGISVMSQARNKFPSADYIYYADTDHVPYGEKTREEIIKYSEDAVDYLIKHGAKVIVIACNTATSIAVEYLRQKYDIPIIGMEPAVKPAAKHYDGSEILVCATPITIKGKKLHTLIEKNFAEESVKPTLLPLPKLVRFAENAIFDTKTVCEYLKEEILNPTQYSAVVLGCTHFPYFKDSFREFFGSNIELIDGTEGTVNHLINIIHEIGFSESDRNGNTTYVRSGREVVDKNTLEYYHLLENISCHTLIK